MHRELASMILRVRGREPWEVQILVAFLEESGVLAALPEDADYEDIDEAARVILARGAVVPEVLCKLLSSARDERLDRQRAHIVSLVESLANDQEDFGREEVEDRVEQLAMVESQIARVGVPRDLVVPVAGLLQAADCTVSPADSPEQIRLTIHHAAKRLLQSVSG